MKTNIPRWFLQAGVLLTLGAFAGMVALQAHWNEPGLVSKAISQDDKEKEVRSFLESVGATYRRHDAKAVSEMFLPDGELVDADGNVLRSRNVIEAHYAENFKAHPQSSLTVTGETVRLIGDSLAMFDGMAEVKLSAREPLRRTRFAAVLAKQGNQWQIASIRDLEDYDNDPAVIKETLASLDFLVGQWVEEGGDFKVHTNCQWSDDKMSLIQTFKISGTNIKELSGTQRIGWDPATQKIKSWSHDNQGGHAEALWTSLGDSWMLKSTGVNSEGNAVSMTSVYKQAGNGRIDIFFRDRVVGDVVMPDVGVTIVRMPPEAKP
ncbi:MAG: SgcJ/EcaC family oxidoreductase [Gemmatales bacterium]